LDEKRPGNEFKKSLLTFEVPLDKFWLVERREAADDEVLLPPLALDGEEPEAVGHCKNDAVIWFDDRGERATDGGGLSASAESLPPEVLLVSGFIPFVAAFIRASSLTRF
jgi:hypothetical protein